MTDIKRVKIDEHIKSTAGTNAEPLKRKRGRPRKNSIPSGDSQQAVTGGNPLNSIPFDSQNQAGSGPAQPPKIEPVYDTTEEAKAFIRAPFDIAAGLTGIKDLALYPAQLEALTPSFKVVYDKRIAPYMGANADIYAFCIVMAGITFEKVQVFREHQARMRPQAPNKNTDESGAPFIPTTQG